MYYMVNVSYFIIVVNTSSPFIIAVEIMIVTSNTVPGIALMFSDRFSFLLRHGDRCALPRHQLLNYV